jgi:hypothetical protein
LPSLEDDEKLTLIELSRSAAHEELARRAREFDVENQLNYEAEAARLEKLFSFQRRHFEQRIERTEAQINRLLSYGTDQERRVIPALRGRNEQDLRRIAAIDERRGEALSDLETRSEPSQQIRPVGITLLVPLDSPGLASTREGASTAA